jgi:rhomboid protease GluP
MVPGYRHSMAHKLQSCPSCRALLDAHETTCPYCGHSLARKPAPSLAAGAAPGLFSGYIVGVCAVSFVLELVASLGALGGEGVWKALLKVPGSILFQMGARSAPMIALGEWWRLIVPVFLHGSVFHLLFNSMALVQVGPLAEQAYGRSRFVLIFFVSGLMGNVLGLMVYGDRGIGVGASGALFGLIGAAGLYGHRRGDSVGMLIRRVMIQWGFYALIFGLLIGADNAAHVGGLLSGFALSLLVGDTERRTALDRIWPALAGVATAVTIVSFALAVHGFVAYGRPAGRVQTDRTTPLSRETRSVDVTQIP